MEITPCEIIRLIDRAIDTNPSLKEHQDNFQILGTLNELKNKLIKSISFEVILNSEERQTMGYLKLHYKN
jgi:hypothetical protein